MRHSPEISVVISSYNHGRFLDGCLASVLQQQGPSYEVIVVDDGSTDDTQSRLEKFSSRILYVYQENKGVSAARNTGLRLARGKYIQFLDADDLLSPDCLARKHSAMLGHDGRDILVCKNRTFTEDGTFGKIKLGARWGLPTTSLDLHLCRLNIAPPHAYFVPRSLIDEIGFFNERYHGCEDYDFWLRALGARYCFHYQDDTEVYYRRNVGGKTGTKARVGKFPFDVLVHRRKHDGDYGAGVDSVISSPAGLLAMADGMLRTASKINPSANREGRDALARWSALYIDRYLEAAVDGGRVVNFECRLYIRRLLQKRNLVAALENQECEQALDRLSHRYKTLRHLAGDLAAMYPYYPYERQLLIYSTFWSLG